ncbi:glycosyltransferase family 39 protein [Salinibacterium sp. ZJ77]|uniref:glycosyltransferase family 39 protein n=1 Tax=Salinibacterium sp. ZJ77 TaxID=2708337 RepID=UPI00142247A7|nr:glycosyltransferase family 39 protein [Salinibacterium sp. ZJ77]
MFCALIVLSAVISAVVHVPGHERVSQYDEYVYIDYLARVPTDGVVARGETEAFAREYVSCHGVRSYEHLAPSACASRVDVDDDNAFPYSGLTSADIYSPAYFWVTWAIAQPLTWLGADLVFAGRMAGAVWLGLAGCLLFAAVRRLVGSRAVAFGASLLVLGSAPAYWAHTYISTDATAILAGSALLYAAVRWEQSGKGAVLLVLIAGFAGLAKVQNLAAVGAIALFVALGAWTSLRPAAEVAPRSVRSRLALAASVLSAGLVAQGLWVVFRALFLTGPPADQGVEEPLTLGSLVRETFTFLPGVAGGYDPQWSASTPATVVVGTLSLLIVAGVIGTIFIAAPGSRESRLGVAVLVASLVCAPLLAIVTTVVAGYYFELPSRYGLSLLPLMVACSAVLMTRRRLGPGAFAAIGTATWAVSLGLPNG